MNRLVFLCAVTVVQFVCCTSQGQDLADTLIVTLHSEQSQAFFDGRVTVTYHCKQGYEMLSKLSFAGIEGIADEPSDPFQNHEVSIMRGQTFYFKVGSDTTYRAYVVREYSKVLTLELSRLAFRTPILDTTSRKLNSPDSKPVLSARLYAGISIPTGEFASESRSTGGHATTGTTIGFDGTAFGKYFEFGIGGFLSFHGVKSTATNRDYPIYDKYTTVKLKKWDLVGLLLLIGYHMNISSSDMIYGKGLLGVVATKAFSIDYGGWGFDAPKIDQVWWSGAGLIGFNLGILIADSYDLGCTYLEFEPDFAIKSTEDHKVVFSQKISTIQLTFGYRLFKHH